MTPKIKALVWVTGIAGVVITLFTAGWGVALAIYIVNRGELSEGTQAGGDFSLIAIAFMLIFGWLAYSALVSELVGKLTERDDDEDTAEDPEAKGEFENVD